MPVEFIPSAVTHDMMARVERARGAALEQMAGRDPESSGYWPDFFEANAAAVLALLDRVWLPADYAVRYCFFGRQYGDLLVRPFVARATTDVSAVRRCIDWHPPPDSVSPALANAPTQDAELLYRHFRFERSPVGCFEYWVAMQEIWASARWVHSRIIADQKELDHLLANADWRIDHAVQRCEPAVIMEDGSDIQLAILLHCPLEREGVSLHRVRIDAEQVVSFLETIPVAHGPRGYRLQ